MNFLRIPWRGNQCVDGDSALLAVFDALLGGSPTLPPDLAISDSQLPHPLPAGACPPWRAKGGDFLPCSAGFQPAHEIQSAVGTVCVPRLLCRGATQSWRHRFATYLVISNPQLAQRLPTRKVFQNPTRDSDSHPPFQNRPHRGHRIY